MSLFTGQTIMKNLDKDEENKLGEILNILEIKGKKIEEINSKDLSNYEKQIKEKIETESVSNLEKEKYQRALDTLNKLKSPLNRFQLENSELINCIENGNWIAFDGIEMANPQVAEKLSSLCGQSPSLNVF